MGKIYVNDGEYDFLVRLIEDTMLTEGELDSEWYECAENLLIKLGYPESYRKEITERLNKKDFRFKRPRCCQERDVKDATMRENTRVLDTLFEVIWNNPPTTPCHETLTKIGETMASLRLKEVK